MEEDFGLGVVVAAGFDQAVMRSRIALRAHGFSILSEMSAPPTLGGDDAGRRHLFMCVWEQLVSTDNLGGPGLDVGDHISTNFVVFEDEGQAMVAALDPEELGSDGGGEIPALIAMQRALSQVLTQVGEP